MALPTPLLRGEKLDLAIRHRIGQMLTRKVMHLHVFQISVITCLGVYVEVV
jgi:hypothetical protein